MKGGDGETGNVKNSILQAKNKHTNMSSRASLKVGVEEDERDHQKLEQVLCMKGGDSEFSYAKNMAFQITVQATVKPVMEEGIKELYNTFLSSHDHIETLVVADLGCATGPIALLAISNIINIVGRSCDDSGRKSPSFFVLLNDLPSNDFNFIFKLLGEFYILHQKEGRECFVAAAPGSFHSRLFPSKSVHFVHSSLALQWLSQVPKGLIDENGVALNKGNICVGETSSLAVRAAYADQFKSDFDAFLKSRSKELILGGSMILTFIGGDMTNALFKIVEVIGLTLADMAREDLINELKLDGVNFPIYPASLDQVREMILQEGSFEIRKLEIIKIGWDAGWDDKGDRASSKSADRGEFVAKYMRAVFEVLLVAKFGEDVLDEVFGRAAVKYTELMNVEDCQLHNIVVWVIRK
uniref:Uncharacterized protein n=1 Tax=Kalanchoe fedtschenkoi TaxID=63787 RepID=A0A7N0T3B1_KALFE